MGRAGGEMITRHPRIPTFINKYRLHPPRTFQVFLANYSLFQRSNKLANEMLISLWIGAGALLAVVLLQVSRAYDKHQCAPI